MPQDAHVRSGTLFGQLVEHAPHANVLVDADGRIQMVNANAERLFGYDRAELVGKTIDLLVPERFRTHHAALRKVFAAEHRPRPMGIGRDLYGCRKDASEFPIEIGLNPVDTELGPMVLAAIVDISVRKALEDDLRQTNERLSEAMDELTRSNRDLNEFAYIAAHDLKEPLRGICSYATFLREDCGDRIDAQGHQYIDRMQDLSRRLSSLIDTLLSYSRLGNSKVEMTEVDTGKVVARVFEDLEPLRQASDAIFRIVGNLPTIMCNEIYVTEVFQNLISNGIKYNNSINKIVDIGYQFDEINNSFFFVRDNGIGIDAVHHENIFKIFKRLHERHKYGGGTGAGLTIVKKVVELHGGRIWLKSTLGEGTTFCFTLGADG